MQMHSLFTVYCKKATLKP